jgi:putative membrane protein
MMKHSMLIAACLLAAAGASAQAPVSPAPAPAPTPAQTTPQQQPDTQGPSMGERTGVDSMLKVTPSTQEFVKDAALSDKFQIAESQLAADRGNAKNKAFATKMIEDHQKTTAELTALLQSKNIGVTPPADLDSAHQSKLDKLKTLKGADFDKRYAKDQIDAHKDGVSLFQRYAKSGDNQDLKEWAIKTAPALQGHLRMAKKLSH